MKSVEGNAEVIQMTMFTNSVRMAKHLLRLPVRRDMASGQAEDTVVDEALLARIAQAYPELIVMASELRDYRV
jgi:hypothetical protein